MTSSRKISHEILAVMIAATLLTSAIITMSSNIQFAFAQQPQPQPQPVQPQPQPVQPQPQPVQPQPQLQQQQPQQQAPLNFYLKLANNASTAQATSQAAANGTGTKNMTVTVNVQRGPGGQQIPLPISALVPANIQPQDLQLCASLATGSESCQPLSGGQQAASIDLTQGAGATTVPPTGMASPMPAPPAATISPMPTPAPQSYPRNEGEVFTINQIVDTFASAFMLQYVDAQLISVEDTTVNIPITVIVPIDLNIQNAQICASVASSGDQSCTQVVLNPEQTSYTDVDVDLSTATPTLTTAEQEPTTTALTTAAPTTEPAPTTTTETAPTTSTTEPALTEEPTTETGTEEGGTTTEEPATGTDTAEEPSTDGGASEGSTE
jgi:hypothetical protein